MKFIKTLQNFKNIIIILFTRKCCSCVILYSSYIKVKLNHFTLYYINYVYLSMKTNVCTKMNFTIYILMNIHTFTSLHSLVNGACS